VIPAAADPAAPGRYERYPLSAIVLHWVTAALVAGSLLTALWLEQSTGAQRGELVRLHKSLGLTILVLSAVRVIGLAWLRRPTPHGQKPWERRASRALHATFYGLLLAIPLCGWAMISADSGNRKTLWFGWLHVPKIQLLADLPAATRLHVHGLLANLHLALALTLLALLLVHVAAVAKHELRDDVRQLRRMTWKAGA
jgi:cytochrome b561